MGRILYRAQRRVLRVLQSFGKERQSISLFAPRMTLHIGFGHARSVPVSGPYDEIFVARIYRPPIPLTDRPRILDIGGHIGLAALYFVHEFPGAQVQSFEPNPTTFALLRKNLAPFEPRAKALPYAVSTEDKTAEFFITVDNPTNVTSGLGNREETGRDVRRIEVACVDIRKYLATTVDFMKLDVEGEEYNILAIGQFVPDRVRAMAIEFHDIEKRAIEFKHIIDLLTRVRGYQLYNEHNQRIDAPSGNGSVVLKFAAMK